MNLNLSKKNLFKKSKFMKEIYKKNSKINKKI